MAFVTKTDPTAAVREAEELRRQANNLLAQADALDPPVVEVKQPKKATKKKGDK